MQMGEITSKLMPIIILIALGKLMNKKQMMKQSTIDEIKSFIINIALSSVLFIAFVNMELRREYFLVFIMVFITLCIQYILGFLLNRVKWIKHPVVPFITSGCTYGLLGIPLFAALFGIENVGKISILGVGHEFFIWLVFYTIMRMNLRQERISIGIAKAVIKSPTIISIALGILFNMLGLGEWLRSNPIATGVYTTLEYLANLATPLILIIIGYGLNLEKKYMKESLKLLSIRMLSMLSIGYAVKFLVIDKIMQPDILFNYAYFIFFILPPPLSLSIFIGTYSNKENEALTNNTVVLNTVVSISIFALFVILK